MPTSTPTGSPAAVQMLPGFSLEMTGRDVPALQEAGPGIPPGTRINVTFLAHEDPALRVAAARAVREHGFVPVPHVSARRLRSRAELDAFLVHLAEAGAAEQVLVVGGDPGTAQGPYEDALAVIRSGALQRHGVRGVGIGGYPEGHPAVDDDVLWSALAAKTAALREQGLEATVITQFGFDTAPVLSWLAEARRRGIDAPVRIGVPGPAGVRRLLGHARRFGVATSAGIAQKYGLSLTHLLGTAGPDRFLHDLAAGYDAEAHGPVRLHFYTFGGLGATACWVRQFGGERVAP
ncbi:5,10-methylenetetrahydrofolate reductase [Kocuria sp. CNJ-770]|uniref:methylenetetrahydrofolate reductase n=1 Tax=Kocuria sp. CNJ-770 TaxID=1904964 RepID=UPI000969F8D8|nr:methylenetetrahydrofolate reductase [Kocuria sp. CNJ-770]OLT08037.1 5,10-methylenetetrahydrofolate reductase [Kocuria sp. CNJ-770]